MDSPRGSRFLRGGCGANVGCGQNSINAAKTDLVWAAFATESCIPLALLFGTCERNSGVEISEGDVRALGVALEFLFLFIYEELNVLVMLFLLLSAIEHRVGWQLQEMQWL